MYHNLEAEMARNSIDVNDIAKAIDVNEKTVRNKLSGKTKFIFDETIMIKDTFFPDLDLQYLFAKDSGGDQ